MSLRSMSQKLLGTTLLVGSMLFAGAQSVKLPEKAQLVKTSNPEQVEVVEVFSYTCGHCYQLEAPVANWLKTKPDDVNFVRIHMPGEGVWGQLSRTFFTLEAMGELEKAHPVMYQALMVDRMRDFEPENIAAYLQKNAGIDEATFLKTWNSFPVTASYNRALDLVQNQYQQDYTPFFIIDGEYLVNGETSKATSYEGIVEAVDQVSKSLLKEKQAKAPKQAATAQ
ncbi:thiol:disulfide interchange protein DsbA/DsbL [Wohlfahrtiimonas chitiniclastica]|nr:thiol:disulfide interchange protein DsbA/DsbL [Wohlfahrtiimonas chitiniclastica]